MSPLLRPLGHSVTARSTAIACPRRKPERDSPNGTARSSATALAGVSRVIGVSRPSAPAHSAFR